MGNIGNLKTPRTTKEAREIGAKGGRASGVARRKKRDAKESAKLFLQLTATGNLNMYLEQLNVKTADRTNVMGIIAKHVIKAQSGDEKSARLVFELSGDLSRQGTDNKLNLNIGKVEDEGIHIYLPEIEKLPED
jgi:hypothetical protein